MDPRAIDPTECIVRHVRRGEESDPSAFALGRVFFVRDDVVRGEDGLQGRQGWQQGETTAVLSDDGSFSLVLPNVAGDDGVLHRRRFAILTDPYYQPGEEWLEFWTDADQERPVFVGTPTDFDKSKTTVAIKGGDLNAVLAGMFSSDADAWDGSAPADVLRHYSRLPVLAYGADLSVTKTGGVGAWGASPYSQALTDVAEDCWIAEARLRWTSAKPTALDDGAVRLDVAGLSLWVDMFDGDVLLTGVPERPLVGKRQGLVVPDSVSLRIIARYDRIFAFVAGELVCEFRRAAPFPAVDEVEVNAYGGTITIDGLHVETLADFACRGDTVVERHLPGIPPPVGLRGRYWNAGGVYAQNTTRDGRLARLWPLTGEAEPVVDRVDPQLNFPAGTPSYPPNLPGASAARWTGAIYLDLAAADRKVRLSGLVGNARVYIGRTLRGEEAASSWAAAPTTPITSSALRAWLGESVAGWYPIVVEHAHDAAAAGIVLEDTALDGGGSPVAWATVPQARLSPYGCYDDLVRLTSHRQVYGDVAAAFGYQWRVEPRSAESGEFPGQLTFASLVGRQTSVVIDDDAVGTDAEVSGAAGDVIDGLLADAAGIADPDGAGQLTVQVVDYERAVDHLALRQAYESLSEISEAQLLATRVGSMLALRSSPNEQVGVRPRGQRDLVDTFPLTGDLARMDWMPGDGTLLELDSVDVTDLSPRQLTSVTWPWRPNGIGAPTVGFRQRPRSVRAALGRLRAAIYGPRRNYQGQTAIATGSVGGATSAGAPALGGVDGYSRAPLPAHGRPKRVVAVVEQLSGTGWRLEVAGVDLGTPDGVVSGPGRYDITRAAKAAGPGSPYIYARLIGGASGSYSMTLEVTVRV